MAMFDQKVALVTGAASGIGRASAQLFAEHGAAVMVSDIDVARGNETVKLIADAGGRAEFIRADVSQSADVQAMVDATIDAFGRLDFAHNNAGIPGLGMTIPDYPEDEWNKGIGVMLNGVFLGMKYQIPKILAHGDGGAIVNTSSGAGLIGFPGMSPYVAAKHGVIGLTKTAALEFGSQGVRINAICPGTARTQMVDDWLGDSAENLAQVEALHPIGRLAQPREIAEAAIWLCSPAASFVLGIAMPVEGGYTAQ